MTTWTSNIPAHHEYSTIQLLRVPAATKLLGITINRTLEGCITHWDGRRTSACPGDECPIHRAGHAGRWHAYVPIWGQTSGKIAVIQLTALAAGALQEEAQRWGTLRGLLIQISRVKPRDNARIVIEARKLPTEPLDLPQPIDVQRFMDAIWNEQSHSRNANGQTRKEPHQCE